MKRLFSRLIRKSEPAPPPAPSAGESSTFLTGDDRLDSRNLRLLLDSMAELISEPDQGKLIRKIVDRAVQAMDAERGMLFLEEGGEPMVKVARDDAGNDLEEDVRYSTTVVKEVFEKGEGLCLRIGDSAQTEDLSASVVDLKLRAVLCVRLRFQEKVLGVIYVDSRVTSREFNKRDLRFFDAMAVALSIALENSRLLQEALERERLQHSMEIARDVLVQLLPPDPEGMKGIDVAGGSTPAETAAGDYYDFIPCADGRLGVVVGDVTGHGVGPAMIMTGARSAMRTLFNDDLSESRMLERLNRRLEEDLADDKFMSMILCRLDPRERVLTFSNAGQSSPLLLRSNGEVTTLEGKGPALGIDADIDYQNEDPVQLQAGDVLVVFTDGIIEVRSPSGEEYGMKRLVETLRRLRGESAKAIVAGLEHEANRYAGDRPPEDDITLVVLKVLEDG